MHFFGLHPPKCGSFLLKGLSSMIFVEQGLILVYLFYTPNSSISFRSKLLGIKNFHHLIDFFTLTVEKWRCASHTSFFMMHFHCIESGIFPEGRMKNVLFLLFLWEVTRNRFRIEYEHYFCPMALSPAYISRLEFFLDECQNFQKAFIRGGWRERRGTKIVVTNSVRKN